MRRNYTYDAFGKLEGRSGYTENSYQFAGEQFDRNLGEYYLRQRYYSHHTGRFSRKDTYQGSFSEPLTLHKYLYAHGNPINGIDPSGLSTLTLAEADATLLILGTLAHTFNTMARAYNPEPLGGFGEGIQPQIPNHTGRLLDKLLNFGRLGGFGEGARLQTPTHTGRLADSSLASLLSHIFPMITDDGWEMTGYITNKLWEKHGLDGYDVDNIIRNAETGGAITTQDDGATVFIDVRGRGNYAIVVVAEGEGSGRGMVVTAFDELDYQELRRVAANNGWEIPPTIAR